MILLPGHLEGRRRRRKKKKKKKFHHGFEVDLQRT
jgi:hypothetical protein